jgi:ligand-binding sensor domain-containing protein
MKTRILVLILNLFWLGVIQAQNNIGKFSNFSIKNGLSQSTIFDIFQDKKGLMWFGTDDGLNKFDGKKFTIYKNNYRNNNSLSDNSIVKILMEDSKNNLWILTKDGNINEFSLRTQQFHRFVSNNSDSSLSPFDRLFSITEDKDNNVWITTSSEICKINSNTHKIKKYRLIKSSGNREKYMIPRLKKDSGNNLWLLTMDGLSKYDKKQDVFVYSGNLIRYLKIREILIYYRKNGLGNFY